MDLLIHDLPKGLIREVLIENDILTQREKVSASKTELFRIIINEKLYGQLKTKVYEGSYRYSYTSRLTKIIGDFYNFKRNLFSSRFGTENLHGVPLCNIPFHSLTVEKLTHYFVHSSDVKLDNKKKVLTILDYYAKELGLNDYNSIVDKPMWVLGKGLQEALSHQLDTYISLSDVGERIFNSHNAFVSDKMIRNPTTRPEYSTFEKISKFIEDNINKKEHKKYLLGLLEVVAYSANIPFHVMKDHPKAIERALIQRIVQKLSVLKNSENWNRDTPSLVELSSFFGIPRHTFDSVVFTKSNMLYRVFTPQELQTIAQILKSKLGPVDSKACTELLLDLGNYDPIQRVADIEQQFPTWTSWVNYEYTAIHGDSDSKYPPKWGKPSWKGTMKEKLAWSQGGFYKKGVLHFFDGISGKILRIDDPNLDIHHIDFDKDDSSFSNLLLIHKDSHITRFAKTPQGDTQRREYISLGKRLKLAFIYGFPPRSWSSIIQAEFIASLNSQARRFI